MRAQWLQQNQARELLVLYSGWAVGAAPFAHLCGAVDVLMLSDYRDERLPEVDVAAYHRVTVLAYSIGVAVAARHLPKLRPNRAIAICGAPDPRGVIGAATYDATAANLGPAGFQRFMRRAAISVPEPEDYDALQQELQVLATRPPGDMAGFDRIVAGTGDRIFPRAAMARAWERRDISWIETGHNPFGLWHNWQDI